MSIEERFQVGRKTLGIFDTRVQDLPGASKLAECLGKPSPRIEVMASSYYFPRDTEDLLLDCFGHD
ncbi:hypothetical protein [Oligoflexus sp.]|uniref:hypothetical protein n=1 Tax=Oligoflexus sp. TaxID=1971216 RepID=UPI002D76D0D8|nr:hypothetical protein [Oligoflexus sp.]